MQEKKKGKRNTGKMVSDSELDSVKINRIIYGAKDLKDCMIAVIKMHTEK